MNTKLKGYSLAIIAATTYGMNPLFTLPLYKAGMDADSVLFFRYLLAIPIMAAMIFFRKRSFHVEKKTVVPLFIMGVLCAVSSLTLFMSYHYMAAGVASTILFVYPIMVAVMMTVFFKEKISIPLMLSILMALAGIALLFDTGDGGTLNLTGVFLVLVSALTYALYIVGANTKWLRDIPTIQITFYVLCFGVGVYFISSDFGRNLVIPTHWTEWSHIFGLALFTTAVSFVCTTNAIHLIGSTPTAILGAMEPLTAVFFGVLIFHEPFTADIMLGITLIILAVILVISAGNIRKIILRIRKMFPVVNSKKH